MSEPGCFPVVEHPVHTAATAGARGRRGRDRPRHLLHPGRVARPELLVAAFAEQADEPRRAVVVDLDRGARPVGRAVRLGREEVRLVDPRAGVEDARAGGRGPLRRRRPRATGRSGASGPRSRARRRCPGARSPRWMPVQVAAPQRRGRQARLQRAEAGEVERGDGGAVAGVERERAERALVAVLGRELRVGAGRGAAADADDACGRRAG